MASQMAILSRARKTLLKTLNHHNNPFKASISTFTFLSLEAQLVEPSLPPPSPTPLPPNPASGSPLYKYFLWMDLYFIYIRMLQTGKESMPDDESYELVVGMLFLTDQIDAALRYVDLTLKSGYMLSMRVFVECVRSCVNKGRLDALVSIIERCKDLQFYSSRCIMGDPTRSLRQKKAPQPESYLAKIYADAALGNLQRAFSTLHEFETAYRNSPKEAEEDIFSPFTSLHPLVMASSKKGFETLDTVEFLQLYKAFTPTVQGMYTNCTRVYKVLQHKQNVRRGLNAIKVHGVAVGTRHGGTPSSPHADALGDQASVGYAHA
ncbi:hypothetical protein VitviT2T_027907 [Vitis vinifera]|uniref:Pentatricopeptide repeat-containing protein, mitochondrial n=1 Tax=Vitis vinifera TaxID=29760 RepID=A0ABY9DSK2_VITVI|nr:hypothetical protein VitviT2T_027907 [Vitis vinifera]